MDEMVDAITEMGVIIETTAIIEMVSLEIEEMDEMVDAIIEMGVTTETAITETATEIEMVVITEIIAIIEMVNLEIDEMADAIIEMGAITEIAIIGMADLEIIVTGVTKEITEITNNKVRNSKQDLVTEEMEREEIVTEVKE
jgi:hypothetical protein